MIWMLKSKAEFKLPREHGLVAIWAGTVILSFILPIGENYDILGFIVSLLFTLSIMLSYESIRDMVKTRFVQTPYKALSVIVIISLLLFIKSFSTYTIILFVSLGLIAGLWAFFATRSKRQNYYEIVLGSFSLTMQFPIIYNAIRPLVTLDEFLTILAIWWIFNSVTVVIILNVGCYRGIVPHHLPMLAWLLYLLTFTPMFVLGYLRPIALLFMIEPSIRVVRQLVSKATLKSMKKNIKKIGWEMVIAMFTLIALVIVLFLTDIPITNFTNI